MPREHFGAGHEFLPKDEILSFEEIARVVGLLVKLGLRKVRLTGGEPLLRRDLPELVALLAAIPGLDLALTTNGSRLGAQAPALARAGLRRVTVSLDSLDETVFRQMSGGGSSVSDVLSGINAALRVGLRPVKINTVVRRDLNHHAIVDLARHFRWSGHVVRFIEYMPVGDTNGWHRDDVVGAREIVAAIAREFPLIPVEPAYRGEVARRWRYADGGGEIGVIASVTQPFCGDCTRLRLGADGRLFTCLFADGGWDLRDRLREGASDDELVSFMSDVWIARSDRCSELRRERGHTAKSAEMSYLGG